MFKKYIMILFVGALRSPLSDLARKSMLWKIPRMPKLK